MNSVEMFKRAVDEANGCVHQVRVNQLSNSTPCSEWNLKQLLNHMVYELLWIPELLAGKTIAEIGDKYEGDVLGQNHLDAWEDASKKALEAVSQADMNQIVHLSYADKPASEYLAEMSQDILIHGWDVGQSINCSLVMDRQLAEVLYEKALPRKQELIDSGMFGTPLELAKSVDIQSKLLALLGRSTEWQHADKNN